MFGALAAGLAAGGLGFLGARNTNRHAQDNSREQMAFQERMSSTAYQRATEDLRKAGLNPILAAGHSGASTPGGSSAPVRDALGSATSSAMEARRLHADLANLEATNDKIKSDTALNHSLTKVAEANVINSGFNAKLNEAKVPFEILKGKIFGEGATAVDLFQRNRNSFGNAIGSKIYDFFHRSK